MRIRSLNLVRLFSRIFTINTKHIHHFRTQQQDTNNKRKKERGKFFYKFRGLSFLELNKNWEFLFKSLKFGIQKEKQQLGFNHKPKVKFEGLYLWTYIDFIHGFMINLVWVFKCLYLNVWMFELWSILFYFLFAWLINKLLTWLINNKIDRGTIILIYMFIYNMLVWIFYDFLD